MKLVSMSHNKFVLLYILLIGTGALHAQRTKLDGQLMEYEVRFKDLMASRGLSYNEGAVMQSKIEAVVKRYCTSTDGKVNPTMGLLFYHFDNDTLYHWLFNHEKLEASASLPITVDSLIGIENTLKFSLKIDAMLTSRTAYANRQQKYRLHTYESVPIASHIFFPDAIRDKLRGKRHLIILPILNFSSFPFGMLKPWGANHGTLIDSLSYSFAHNFTQFFQSVEKNAMSYDKNYLADSLGYRFRLKNPMALGNPAFMDSCTQSLQPLPGAAREVRTIAEMFQFRPWIGKAAHRALFLDKLPTSNFVYLATHGWADPDAPLDKSFFALNGSPDCGYVTPRQIQSLNLVEKPIVVLSACQTGLGMVHEAGIVGLARSFLKAGAQSVLMSLWNVDDTETETLMTLFVSELLQPHPFFPAEHWRQAVLKYKQQGGTDPLNWAAFQNFGVPYRLRGKVALAVVPR